jgi:hypothetical protein
MSRGFIVESMRDFFGKHAGVVAGFKMMGDEGARTKALIVELMLSSYFPSLRSIFLLRDVLEGSLSHLEARKTKTWLLVNSSVSSSHFTPELNGNVVRASHMIQDYLNASVTIQWSELQKEFLSRCQRQSEIVKQFKWLQERLPDRVMFVRSEDIIDTVTRSTTMERVYSFLLSHSHPSAVRHAQISAAVLSVRHTRNQRGRSSLPLEERVSNLRELCREYVAAVHRNRVAYTVCEQQLTERVAGVCQHQMWVS